MIYFELFLAAFVAAFVSDLSGFMDSVKEFAGRRLGHPVRRLRPLDCPLCLSWWCCLAYALARGAVSVLTVAYIALLALMCRPLCELVRVAVEGMLAICRWLCRLVEEWQ